MFFSSNAAKNVHFFEDKGLRCWNAGSSRNKGDKIYGASDLRCWTIGSYQRSRSKGNKYHGASHLKCSNAWSSRIKVLKWWESSHTFERLKRELPHFWAFKARAPILLAFEVKAPTLFGRLKRELPYFWAFKQRAPTLLTVEDVQSESSHTFVRLTVRTPILWASKARAPRLSHRQGWLEVLKWRRTKQNRITLKAWTTKLNWFPLYSETCFPSSTGMYRI